RSTSDSNWTSAPMHESFARVVELDRSPIYEPKIKTPSNARGDWGRGGGGCRLARVHEAGKPQWISGACKSVPPGCSCRLDPGPMWQCAGQKLGLKHMPATRFSSIFDGFVWLYSDEYKIIVIE